MPADGPAPLVEELSSLRQYCRTDTTSTAAATGHTNDDTAAATGAGTSTADEATVAKSRGTLAVVGAYATPTITPTAIPVRFGSTGTAARLWTTNAATATAGAGITTTITGTGADYSRVPTTAATTATAVAATGPPLMTTGANRGKTTTTAPIPSAPTNSIATTTTGRPTIIAATAASS